MLETVLVWLVTLGILGVGMFAGAWFAVRGFEKGLIRMMEDPESPWNKEKDDNSDQRGSILE